MAKSKHRHRMNLARAKSLKAPRNESPTAPVVAAPVVVAPVATVAAPVVADKVRAPYVHPYEEGPEQNAFVESMRVHGARMNAVKAAAKTTKARWAAWFKTDPAMKVLANTTRPIGAWADLMEEEYKRHPELLRPRLATTATAVVPVATTVVPTTVATVVPTTVPVPKGPRASTQTQLIVGNLPAGITASQLISRFEPHGTVTSISIPIDPGTKYTKGFAFVTFSEPEGAATSLRALQGALAFPNPLKKGPRVLVATLDYAKGVAKSKGTMKAREGK